MRVTLLVCIVFCIMLTTLASAQDRIQRGIDRSNLPSSEVETVGGKNLWSYIIFIVAGLVTVYFAFRGNKRA